MKGRTSGVEESTSAAGTTMPKGGRPEVGRPPGLWAAIQRALARVGRETLGFITQVYNKAGQDDIFFLAGGIAFNVFVAAAPFLLMLVAIFGLVLRVFIEDPQQAALGYVLSILPASPQIIEYTRALVDGVISGSAQAGIFGLLLFVWFSTRLIGSLRSVLRDIFDLQEDRGIVAGKIFDTKMVLVAGSLFLINTGITAIVEAVRTFGVDWLGIHEGAEIRALQTFSVQLLAFAFIFLMFALMYRYLPPRRSPWRMALVAAGFTSVVWELLKGVFAWYVANVANYQSSYGALATLIVLAFWIYYSAVVFIIGGEVAYVYELNRIRRRQRELLE